MALRTTASILARLPPELAAVIEQDLTPEARNRVRLDRRDRAIRRAWRDHWPAQKFAAPVARDLARLLRDASGDNSELGRTVSNILELNNGRPIAERQLSEILRDGPRN